MIRKLNNKNYYKRVNFPKSCIQKYLICYVVSRMYKYLNGVLVLEPVTYNIDHKKIKVFPNKFSSTIFINHNEINEKKNYVKSHNTYFIFYK